MPIFNLNGKSINVLDADVNDFIEAHPDSWTEGKDVDGNRYRVNASDWLDFKSYQDERSASNQYWAEEDRKKSEDPYYLPGIDGYDTNAPKTSRVEYPKDNQLVDAFTPSDSDAVKDTKEDAVVSQRVMSDDDAMIAPVSDGVGETAEAVSPTAVSDSRLSELEARERELGMKVRKMGNDFAMRYNQQMETGIPTGFSSEAYNKAKDEYDVARKELLDARDPKIKELRAEYEKTKKEFDSTTNPNVAGELKDRMEGIQADIEFREKASETKAQRDAIEKSFGNVGAELKEETNRQNQLYSERKKKGISSLEGAERGIGGGFAVAAINERAANDQDYIAMQRANVNMDRAAEVMAEYKRVMDGGGWWTGVGKGLQTMNLRQWDFGQTDFKHEKTLAEAMRKFDKGEKLSKAEEILLDSEAIRVAAEQAYKVDWRQSGFGTGEITAASLPFMAEMMSNPASGLGKGLTSASLKLLSRYARRYASSAARKAILKGGATGIRLVGDVAGAGVMAGTTGMGGVMADATARERGQAIFDGEGYGGHEAGDTDAFRHALTARTIDNFTEIFPMFKGATALTGKVANKISPKWLTDAVKRTTSSDWAKGVDNFFEKTQWHGPVEEYFEEVEAGLLNMALVGDETADEFFTWDKQIETFLGVALMGGAMSSLKTLGYRSQSNQAKHDAEKLDKWMREHYGQEWEPVEAELREPKLAGAVLAEMASSGADARFREMALRYAGYRAKEVGAQLGEDKLRELHPEVAAAHEAYDEGRAADDDAKRATIESEFEAADKALREVYGDEGMALLEGDDFIQQANKFVNVGDDAGLLQRYVNARAAREGMMDAVESEIDDAGAQSDAEVDAVTNRETGMVQAVELKDGSTAHVVSGRVALYDDGLIDESNSSKSLVILRDGKLEFTAPNLLSSASAEVSADERKAQKREEIEAKRIEEVEAGIEREKRRKATMDAMALHGDNMTLLGDDGTVVTGVTISPSEDDGMVVVQGAKEIYGANAKMVSIDDVAGRIMQNQQTEEAVAPTVETPTAVETTETPDVSETLDATNENAQEVASAPTAEVAPATETAPVVEGAAPVEGEAPQSALAQMPRDEEGNIQYTHADADMAWDAIVEESEGDETLATDIAGQMLADAKDNLKKMEKAKPKVKSGASVSERIAAAKAQQAAVEEAKQTVEAWERIVGTQERRRRDADYQRQVEAEKAAAARKAEEERLKAEAEEAARVEREALNGVPDMADDTPQDARARGYRRVGGHKVERQSPVRGVAGKEVQVKFSNKAMPQGRVMVIEANELQPSHTQGQRNAQHFLDEAQPKERKDSASMLAAQKIAENIRPEEITSSVTAYTGAPTTNSRGEVIQGNSRSDALKQMWDSYPEQATKYKQYLIDHAEELGLDAEAVAQIERPVLVNMLEVADEDAITLGQFVAQDTESGGVERIKAKNVLQKMGSEVRNFANRLLQSADEETSFAGLIDANGANVVQWMAQKGYITPTQQQSAYDGKGNLTAEAKNDLRSIMYQNIFKGGNTQLEEMFNALPVKAQKAILATAYRDFDSPVAERMIEELQSSISAFYVLSQDSAFASARNITEARAAIEAWKNQYQMDDVTGESYLPSDKFSNFALHLATMYKGENQSVIQGTFNKMFDLIQGIQEADLFNDNPDTTPRTLVEAIKEVLNIDYNGQLRSNVLGDNHPASQRGQQGSTGNVASGEQNQDGQGTDDGGRATEGDGGRSRSEAEDRTSQSNEDANNGREESVATPVALSYLLEGGRGSIENAGYFLYGVQAAFPHISAQIQRVRDRIESAVLGMTPDAYVSSNHNSLSEIRDLVSNAYGEAGLEIYDKLLANSTGFYPREGVEVGRQIENLQPQEKYTEQRGAFGNIYTQFKGKAKEAIQFLLEKKEGEAVAALHHPEIGDIDLVWGKEGTGKSDGFGLAKLAKYHPEVLDNLQEILDEMKVTQRSENRVQLESDTHQAAVRLTWDNVSKNWLLTAFEKKNSAFDNTTDTGETSNGGKRNDTATPQNTVSNSKVTDISTEEQKNEVENVGGAQKQGGTSLNKQVQEAEAEVNVNPTEKQKEAGAGRNKPQQAVAGKDGKEQGAIKGNSLAKGAKWEKTGEPEKFKTRTKKHADSHDVSWRIGKKQYGSTTAERDLLRILADEYDSLNAIWNAYENGEILLSQNEAAILKKLIETGSKKAELQQGELDLDVNNPAFERATTHTIDALKAAGVEVVEATQEMVDAVMGLAEMHKQKKAPETASVQEEHQPTVVSGADKRKSHGTALLEDESSFKGTAISSDYGAKILKDLDSIIKKYENKEQDTKTFLGDIASALGIDAKDKSSKYATFEARNGTVFTIRISNHNATVSNFDNLGENNGISIVVSRKPNTGIANDGDAHLVEFFYSDKKLKSAEGKPLVEILKSIKQSLYSGEFKDNTGIAQVEEVNIPEFMQVYHGSGAKFDRFDHSFMGTGEGVQAFGWGTYVTESEGIGRNYAKSSALNEDAQMEIDSLEDRILEIRRYIKYNEVGGRVDNLADAKRLLKSNKEYFRHDKEWAEHNKDEAKELQRLVKEWETIERRIKELNSSGTPNLYTVEIPDDNGSNYLYWEKNVPTRVKNKVRNRLYELLSADDAYKGAERELRQELNDVFSLDQDGATLYGNVSAYLGSDKAASLFLNEMGYVGIKYPTGTMSGGNKDGSSNYVIFNENNLQIRDRVQFLRTPNGTVYGWAVDGKVYLTPEGMNPNTPAHEYTHLWATMVEKSDSKLWGRIVDGLRGSAVWNDVLADKAYEDIWGDENRMASEVLSRLTGAENYRREMERAQKEIADAKGAFDKMEKISAWERVKQSVKAFLNKVKSLLGFKDNAKPAEEPKTTESTDVPAWMEFVDMVLGDLYELGVNPDEVLNRRGRDAQSVETISKEFDLHPSAFAEFINTREDFEKYKALLDEEIYKAAVEDYEYGAGGVAFSDFGLVFVFKENCIDEHEEQIVWWHEQTHVASHNLPISDEYKDELAKKTLKWLEKNAPKVHERIITRYKKEAWNEEGIAMFIGELVSRYGTSKFLKADFAELGELATLADIIRNSIKYGTEDTKKKFDGGYGFGQSSSKSVPEFDLAPSRKNETLQEGRLLREGLEEPGEIRGDETQGAGSEDEVDTLYRIREEAPPQNTGIGYKVFVLKDGKLYPPMVANPNGEATPVGVWLDADAAPVAGQSKTGRTQVKAGGKGTQGGSGKLAYRPGWHLGEIPYALQFNRKDENGERTLFPANFVWAEVEYANDVDYQDEAMSYGYNKNGKFQHSYAGLPRVPENGAYKYRTNPNPETDPWIITGAMRVKRLLTPTEVDVLVKAEGREPQRRQEGAVTDEQINALNAELANNYREGGYIPTDDELSAMSDPISKVLGKSRYSAKQRREFAERARKRMVRKAENLAKQLHLDNVEIVTDASVLEGKKQRAKGFFSKSTGKITIVVPNHSGTADVEQTVFHEAVAHYGLRKLFGEHFDTFLDNVFNHASTPIRKKIIELAQKNGWDFRTATEEYLASLAEETNFEAIENVNSGWWDKIKGFFIDMLAKAGVKLDFTLSDAELRYVLWRSYQNLVNPGRYKSVADQAVDIAKQYELKVGNYRESVTDTDALVKIAEHANDELFRDGEDATPVSNIDRFKATFEGMGIPVKEDSEVPLAMWSHSEDCLKVNPDLESFAYGEIIGKAVEQIAWAKGIDFALGGQEKADAFFADFATDVLGDFEEYSELAELFREAGYDSRKAAAAYVKQLSLTVPEEDLERNGVFTWVKNRMDEICRETYGECDFSANDLYMIFGSVAGRYAETDGVRGVMERIAARWDAEHSVGIGGREEGGAEERADTGGIPPTDGGTPSDGGDGGGKKKKKLPKKKVRKAMKEDMPSRVARIQYEEAVATAGQSNIVAGLIYAMTHKSGWKAFKNDFAEGWFDYARSIRQLQKAIENAGGEVLTDLEKVWEGVVTNSSKSADEIRKVQRDLKAPLVETVAALMKEHKKTLADVEKYLYAKHALERNRVMMERALESENEYERKRAKRDYSGLTELFKEEVPDGNLEKLTKQAERVVAEFEAKVGAEAVSKLWADIRKLTDFALKKDYDSGLIGKDLYLDVTSMYENYVPLRGWANDAAADVYTYHTDSKGADGRLQSTMKKAYGRTSQATDIFGHILSMADSSIVAGNKNLVKQRLLWLAQNHPSDVLMVSDVWYVQDASGRISAAYPNIHEGMTPEEVQEEIADFDARMKKAEEEGTARRMKSDFGKEIGLHMRPYEEQQHGVRVMVNGKEKIVWVVGNPKAAMALNGLLNVQDVTSIWNDIANKMLRTQNMLNTSLNPEFVVGNAERDFVTTLSSAFIKKGPKYMAKWMKNMGMLFPFLGRLGKNHVNMFRLMKKYEKGTLDMSNPTERMFHEFTSGGGITGITAMQDVEAYANAFANDVDLKNASWVKRNSVKLWSGFWGGIEWMNNSVENAARFATYVTSREEGESILDAVTEAKENSVNFNVRGSGAWGNAYARKYIGFANAALQGARVNNEWWNTSKGKTIMVYSLFAAMGVINALICSALYDGDDDDDEDVKDKEGAEREWYGLSEFNRYNYLNIPGAKGGWFRYSIPHEFRAPFTIGQLIVDMQKGKISTQKALTVVATLPQNYSPISVIEGGTDFGDMEDILWGFGKSVAPTVVVKDMLDVAHNKDFLGRRIHGRSEFNKDLPEWQRATDRTLPYAVDASKFMNELFGGAYNRRSGGESILNNPAVWDYMISQRLGAAAGFVRKFVGTVSAASISAYENAYDTEVEGWKNLDELDYRDIPFVKVVWTPNMMDKTFSAMTLNDFYDMKNLWEATDNELRRNINTKELSLDYSLGRIAEMEQDGDLLKSFRFTPYAERDNQLMKEIKEAEEEGRTEDVQYLQEARNRNMVAGLAKLTDPKTPEEELLLRAERVRAEVEPFLKQFKRKESQLNAEHKREEIDSARIQVLNDELDLMKSDEAMFNKALLYDQYDRQKRRWIMETKLGNVKWAAEEYKYMLDLARLMKGSEE